MKVRIIHVPDMLKAASRKKEATVFMIPSFDKKSELEALIKGEKYYIHTYGCQANVRDEETMRGLLDEIGYRQTEKPEEATLIILNTCAVRENAEDKLFGEIGNLKRLRKQNKNLVFAICGCVVEQPEILNKMLRTFKEVNLYFGTHEIVNLYELIYEARTNKETIVCVQSKAGEVIEIEPVSRSNRYKAFVNVIYGCNKFCTYCIVPYTRGKERSRLFEGVINECRGLISQGYQEITLLGQNVNAYGKDLSEGKDFADLLEEVAKLGISRLRFTTSHPGDFSSKMIDVIAKYPNIMKFIHLPVQSGSNRILKAMGRRYTREQYLALAKEMREKIPGLALSTDIIVGFPNETDEEFKKTLSLVDEVKFEAAFTFIFSPRKGTPAAKMEDKVSKETKTKRFQELVKHLEKHIEARSQAMINKTYSVLVDGVSKTDKNMYSGYTEENKLVHFKACDYLIGKIVKVKIIESHTYSLIGEIIDG
ncbi:MAG TPA: tRNA (N6-isopentenyl adenosine(37)-C2)-methylthiotransferase MiaB [Erysipelotrichaceae bacterium]|nr:tRNA (N6-isopentenyl adenosine(37)-C2)-methylthiotransferase MiaB [Erysipelotrichaceae bacterium]